MNISALFRRRGAINLLPKDSFESSFAGRILEWALEIGKWTVIVTQLIVVGAFLFRFGLDRRLTDLRRSTQKEVAMIQSYSQVEHDFRLTQAQLDLVDPMIEQQEVMNSFLEYFSNIIPTDVWFERFSITNRDIVITAYSGSINGFSQFLSALQSDKRFSSINVSSIEGGTVEGAQLQFEISMKFAEDKT